MIGKVFGSEYASADDDKRRVRELLVLVKEKLSEQKKDCEKKDCMLLPDGPK